MTARDLENALVEAAVAAFLETPEGRTMEGLLLEALRRERDELEALAEQDLDREPWPSRRPVRLRVVVERPVRRRRSHGRPRRLAPWRADALIRLLLIQPS